MVGKSQHATLLFFTPWRSIGLMSKAIQGQGEILGDPKMSSHFVEEAGPLDVPLRPVLS